MPADLQSAPFGHSGIDPLSNGDVSAGPSQTPTANGAGPHARGRRPDGYDRGMPSFDVVSEVDRQEVRNAVDQAQREIANRFDFKNTDSSIEQTELAFTLRSITEDRLAALRVVLEEKLVKRGVSLKGLDYGKVDEATQNTVRQVATIQVGISSDKAREINKLIKSGAPKGVSSQTQGDAVRVNSKKRDDLQAVIALLKSEDLGIPLQFINFRD
jgi:cyclic-di-GMP-binding protein